MQLRDPGVLNAVPKGLPDAIRLVDLYKSYTNCLLA
jgi:hypothetical protein